MPRTWFACLFLFAAPAWATPPETPMEIVTDVYHGVEIADPFRWLEGSDAPEIDGKDEALDRRVQEWVEAQNAYTRAILDAAPGRDLLEKRFTELFETNTQSAPRVRGDRYFFTAREGDQAQSVLYVQEGVDGERRVLLDVNRLDEKGLLAYAGSSISQSGELVAFLTYYAGDENTTLNLLRVEDGEWLADEISGKVSGVNWLPDDSGFVYRRLADIDNPYSGEVRVHRIGRHHSHDPILFEQYKEGPLATTWGPSAWTNDEAKWLMLSYWTGTDSNDLWFYNLQHWRETGELVRKDIVIGEKARFSGAIWQDTLLLQTDWEAPNSRVFAVNLHHPERENWQEIIPERESAVLRGIQIVGGRLAASYLENVQTRIELFDFEGGSLGDVELPGIGSASLSGQPDRDEAYLHFSSYNYPSTIFRYDLNTNERSLWFKPDLDVDPEILIVKQEWYESKDGTRVPIFIIHRKDLELDGQRPTILYGYGGFNISMTPGFSSSRYVWMQAGGVYAVANLRGGGEFGQTWHRAGMLENRQNVFDDFIAAAEWLIENGYTSSDHLGIAGGSNGGLLTGAVINQRPKLFGAAYVGVPLLDMLRYQHFLMARYWVPEYGSSEDPEQFEYILAYSPYHNIQAGIEYPAVFLQAGKHDSRVHPVHAYKMAARLQAEVVNDPNDKPILLWTELEAGHGGGKPLWMQVRDAADLYAFFATQLGLDFEATLRNRVSQ